MLCLLCFYSISHVCMYVHVNIQARYCTYSACGGKSLDYNLHSSPLNLLASPSGDVHENPLQPREERGR